MAVQTGASGALKYDGAVIAKCRNWSLSISRDALEATCLGSDDREYVKGLRGATGSATLLYDPDDSSARALLNGIFDNTASDNVEFVFNDAGGGEFECKALLTSVEQSVSVGEVIAVSVGFQVSGVITGVF